MNVAYEVKVIKMLDFGAVVEYLEAPGNEVLLTYLSCMGTYRKCF
jgi:polyribonucleotide nucleotidyltransferase